MMPSSTKPGVAAASAGDARPPHTCPLWIGFLLASPLRRLFENPSAMLLPLVKPGDHVLELGPALGFFTLPLAEAVGPSGQVVCVDVQEAMLARLGKRLAKRGLLERTLLRRCSPEELGIEDQRQRCDLVVALHVVHETLSPAATMAALAECVKPGGQLLLAEPPGHCSSELFQSEVGAADGAGLVRGAHPRMPHRQFVAVWRRPA